MQKQLVTVNPKNVVDYTRYDKSRSSKSSYNQIKSAAPINNYKLAKEFKKHQTTSRIRVAHSRDSRSS
jgi:hypothetical protein